MKTAWDPALYLEFADYRARPAHDLMARIDLAAPGMIIDLGCGPGNLTRKLKQKRPDRSVLGLDSSPAMLERAKAKPADIVWQHADISVWTPSEPPALIFSNAALHWVGDHARLFPHLLASLAAGGLFAVQMPATSQAPYHACLARVLALPRWRALAGARTHTHPLPAGAYHDLLSSRAATLEIWETLYHHVLAGPEAVTAWVSSTALMPYLTALPDSERTAFLKAFTAESQEAYPPQADGKVIFTMRRIFILAQR